LNFENGLFSAITSSTSDVVGVLDVIRDDLSNLGTYLQYDSIPQILTKLDTIITSLATIDGSIGGLTTVVATFSPKLDALVTSSATMASELPVINASIAAQSVLQHNDSIALINVLSSFAAVNHVDLTSFATQNHTDNNFLALGINNLNTTCGTLGKQSTLTTLATHTDVSDTNTALGGIETQLADLQSKSASINTKLATFQINGGGQLRTTLV